MASKSKKSDSKERHRLPPDQQRELEKDGRCRRLFCDILRLRVLAYIVSQPTPFTFILSLFLIAITLPLVGLYISRTGGLPDLDAMQNWNAYIGRLGRKDFCFNISKDEMDRVYLHDLLGTDGILASGEGLYTVGVTIDFRLDRTVLLPPTQTAMAATRAAIQNEQSTFLFGSFKGNHFTTQIKDSLGERIDDKILIHFLVNTSSVNITEACPGDSSQCQVTTCVLISAPGDAVPTRLPQVHHNATFVNKVYGSGSIRRPKECSLRNGTTDLLKPGHDTSQSNLTYYDIGTPVQVRNVTLCSDAKDDFDGLYLSAVRRGASKGHGIIRINLSQDDQQTAANHMYIAALAVAALAVAFAVGITFTDRPPQPKSSQE